MCGISGIWNRDGRAVETRLISAMNRMLVHRGPDGEGVWVDGEIGLGHRRLEILDPGVGGHQPMSTPDGDLWIVFNGEIHNHLELRSELEPETSFRSSCDTEVLLEAYRRWGVGCFPKLNGMWAAAIWDRRERRLVLTRDHFGIKPLCYSIAGSRVAFASEAKAILAAYPEERRVDRDAVCWFLDGGSPDSGRETFFDNVHQVPQSSYLIIGPTGTPRVESYWRIESGRQVGEKEAEEAVRDLLTDAVRLRLRSDVPVGSCLSGGIDSSSIVRLAGAQLDEPMHCFTMRHREPGYDETEFAVAVADDPEKYQHHWIEPKPLGMLRTMERIVWHQDGPCAARGRYGKWHTFEEAGRHVKVVVDGQGADEMFAGYGHYYLPFLLDCLRFGGTDKAHSGWLRQARAVADIWPKSWRSLAARSVGPLTRPLTEAIWPSQRIVDKELRRACRPIPKGTMYSTWLCEDVERPFDSHLDNALWGDFRYSSLPELLHAEDAMGMALSVEARPALLDPRLVELSFSLPFHQKIRDGWRKSVLRRAMDGVLPPKVQWRRDKMGYPLPVYRWLAQDDDNYRQLWDLLLGSDAVALEFVNPRQLRRLLARQHVDGGGRWEPELLWRCATLEIWMRRFLHGGPLEVPSSTAPAADRPASRSRGDRKNHSRSA